MDFWIAFHETRWVEGEIVPYLFLYPPFLKGGLGGFRKRLKIPLNPPFSKGDLKAFSRGLLPTADFLLTLCALLFALCDYVSFTPPAAPMASELFRVK